MTTRPLVPSEPKGMSTTEAALDSRARRAAKRVGLRAEKSRWRRDSIDNYGGFMLVDSYTNSVLWGSRFELSAEQVIAICAEREAA